MLHHAVQINLDILILDGGTAHVLTREDVPM